MTETVANEYQPSAQSTAYLKRISQIINDEKWQSIFSEDKPKALAYIDALLDHQPMYLQLPDLKDLTLDAGFNQKPSSRIELLQLFMAYLLKSSKTTDVPPPLYFSKANVYTHGLMGLYRLTYTPHLPTPVMVTAIPIEAFLFEDGTPWENWAMDAMGFERRSEGVVMGSITHPFDRLPDDTTYTVLPLPDGFQILPYV